MTPVMWFRTQKNRFKRTFFAGTRKCPHNLNRPHFAGVYSYECPHKCAAVSAHIHTLTPRARTSATIHRMRRYPSPPLPRQTHTLKLLLCYYFKEKSVMRHLPALNLACNHRNLRLFDANVESYHISALVCLCVRDVRVENVCMWLFQ